MFSGKNRTNLSIIDKDLRIDGSLVSRGKLIIKGKLTGTIEGETVVIAKEGVVESDAKVSSLTIGGSFRGDIIASKELIILSTGRCDGKVECKDLIVENGGVLNAEVICKITKSEVAEKENNMRLQPGTSKGKRIEL